MSDKPPVIPEPSTAVRNAGFTALSGHYVIELAGRDAVAFAQAQFMSNVAALAAGHWHWSGWLTPKGRVITLFALLKLDDETIWLLLPDADPDALIDQLKRFVFRSKLSLSRREDLLVSGAFAAPVQAAGGQLAGDLASGLELDFSGDGGARCLRIDNQPTTTNDPGMPALWTAFDLRHGLPRLATAQTGQWTPQQLSLDRLKAYSVKKGCYPGQEIVARTHFLGKAKRGLVLVDSDAVLEAGMEVADGDVAIGVIACASGTLALAMVPLDHESVELRVDGATLRQQVLLGGLQR